MTYTPVVISRNTENYEYLNFKHSQFEQPRILSFRYYYFTAFAHRGIVHTKAIFKRVVSLLYGKKIVVRNVYRSLFACERSHHYCPQIHDPYRWLEDPDSNETKEFIEAENKITRPYLDACPVKADVNARLTELWNYPKYSCPFRRGDRYFFYKNTGLQNQK